jgi:hypothetical protein
MNERIKELAEQAEVWNADGDKCEVDLEKFAELLEKDFEAKYFSAGYIQGRSDGTIETVKECLQKCEQIRSDALIQKKSEFLTESGKMLYEGVFGGATNCGFAIQQHFGVEL